MSENLPSQQNRIDAIDAILPQTQCGDCLYPGCRPYAEAIVLKGEEIQRCTPGGESVYRKIATLTQQAVDEAVLTQVISRTRKPEIARIIEADCIGCTKCIKACPVDAIIGSAKQMHVILTSECTGCGLCVDPCPVDCITLDAIPAFEFDKDKSRSRFAEKIKRLEQEKSEKAARHAKRVHLTADPKKEEERKAKQAYIAAAIARAKAKKNNPETPS